jgi:hypothetical protein
MKSAGRVQVRSHQDTESATAETGLRWARFEGGSEDRAAGYPSAVDDGLAVSSSLSAPPTRNGGAIGIGMSLYILNSKGPWYR